MSIFDPHQFTGDMVEVFTNPHGLYEGDLQHYARVVFAAPNIHHGFHGLRHMLHVMWVCYKACIYYRELEMLDARQCRNLLIGVALHDFDHTGKAGDDAVNLRRAVTGMYTVLAPEDIPYGPTIQKIMEASQYPHKDLGPNPSLEELILRDADMTQALGPAWIGEILAGYGSELGKTPIEMLETQLGFLANLHFATEFGKTYFGRPAIDAKVAETKGLLAILKG